MADGVNPAGSRGAGAHRRPAFAADEAARVAQDLFGVRGTARELPSDRDQNFRIDGEGGARFLLKISNGAEDPAVVDLQIRVLEHLAAASTGYSFPSPLPTRGGDPMARVEDPVGVSFLVRLQTFVPGLLLADVRPHEPGLLRGLGGLLATMDAALSGFVHPAANRSLHWDLRHAAHVVRGNLEAVDESRQPLLTRTLEAADARLRGLVPDLRTQLIHNDGNDHNVLVGHGGAEPPTVPGLAVRGIIDFGDLVTSYAVAELAVAAAYIMMGKPDPVAAAAHVVGGYHHMQPLTEVELEALDALIALRLALSVAVSAFQRRREPEKEYLSISEAPAWTLLQHLDRASPDLAHYRFRHACGLEPCPRTEPVVSWLQSHRGGFAPVLSPDPARAEVVVLDLSVGGQEFAEVPSDADAAAWTRALFARIDGAGADVGIGRYDEARRWYTADTFRTEGNERPEWRTAHLGIDLFQPPGSPVYAPLDGIVHSRRDNAGRLDYGPTIILEHEVDGGRLRFYTLYGHLAPDSLEGLDPGTPVRQGQRIGSIGDIAANGGWPPHLHFQLIVDLLGREGEFPGVAPPSQRSVWRSLSPDPNLVLGIPGLGPADEGMEVERLLDARRRRLGPSLSVSYRRPLKIVRGRGQFLYDAVGQPYLDCVNNVAHVGHGHPRVVDALSRQAAVLNTNTRYLHDDLVRYAERLTATLPDPLSVCYFVCSGSEANELALRLARAHTEARDIVVLDGAYHGNTTALVEISPYKFDGPGGQGAPDHVHVAAMPDPYRGPFRRDDEETGRRYGELVRDAVQAAMARGARVAAFFAESLLSCGGQIVLPEGFLEAAYRHVREAGGVCVADEVQVGFGRVGSRFWGFETQGVVPDIVTMGKPIGNGHPLGAVVTTAEVAASFDTGMEYFNTFGGNPVSCRVGLAVLDVIEEEGLQSRARVVGNRLLAGLEQLKARHPLIGDVRGLGLFVGVELVLDPETLEPAGALASLAVERMRERGVLLSTDGPFHNVIKIKPPLVFTERDADVLVANLDAVLSETAFAVGISGTIGRSRTNSPAAPPSP